MVPAEPTTIGEPLLLARGWQLFRHGFYWEAHEAWEQLWIADGRHGPRADLLKGLIKLAACGVKCLAGNSAGARRHAERAGQLLRAAVAAETDLPHCPSDLDLLSLVKLAERLAGQPPLLPISRRHEVRCGGVPILQETMPAG